MIGLAVLPEELRLSSSHFERAREAGAFFSVEENPPQPRKVSVLMHLQKLLFPVTKPE